MTKKLEKLKEVKESLTKRCADLETYMFIENIPNIDIRQIKEKTPETAIEIK